MLRRTALAILFISLASGAACQTAGPNPADLVARQQEVKQALERYMVAARAVDANAVAAFFAPTGVLFEPGIQPIESRDAIRTFMGSFPGVRVDVATSTPDIVEIFGDTAMIWGSYFEKLAFPGQPPSEQHGKFVMEWIRQPDGTWLIQRYFRVPAPTPATAGK